MHKTIKTIILSLILPVLLMVIWQFSAWQVNNAAIIPTIGRVVENFINASDNFIGLGSIPRNVGVSLIRVLSGYTAGVLIAVPLGVLMGYSKTVQIIFETFINIFKPIPPLAWQPLALAIFGVSSIASLLNMPFGQNYVFWGNFKIAMVFLIGMGSFFPIVASVMFGVQNVRQTLIDSARVLGASEKDIFFKVLMPAAAPSIINGLRMGLAIGWACLVGAEMLPGSLAGVGYLITHAYELARTDLVITGMICIGLVGALLDSIFRIIANKYFSWESKTR
ncbi:MAG: putative aliphatic sulfonates transport permease protein SsuC [Firmicutes bacterium ADurb.Bin373]|nr:ABC transporter permease [Bacillota bacterium]OQA10554.1 MAG: putative aliphatic sulfonates transport permease protein SsuC [Firmicutes bacterium ADurb.Bin373]